MKSQVTKNLIVMITFIISLFSLLINAFIFAHSVQLHQQLDQYETQYWASATAEDATQMAYTTVLLHKFECEDDHEGIWDPKKEVCATDSQSQIDAAVTATLESLTKTPITGTPAAHR